MPSDVVAVRNWVDPVRRASARVDSPGEPRSSGLLNRVGAGQGH